MVQLRLNILSHLCVKQTQQSNDQCESILTLHIIEGFSFQADQVPSTSFFQPNHGSLLNFRPKVQWSSAVMLLILLSQNCRSVPSNREWGFSQGDSEFSGCCGGGARWRVILGVGARVSFKVGMSVVGCDGKKTPAFLEERTYRFVHR